MISSPVEEGHVFESEDGLVLLVLGRDEIRGSADQWRCIVLGDFYEGRGGQAMLLKQGHIGLFALRQDMAWSRVSP